MVFSDDTKYRTITFLRKGNERYMGRSIVLWITGIFGAEAGKIIGTFIISMLPIIELRGAIPVAFAMGLNWQTAIICAIIGNILPIPFILLFLNWIFEFMKKHNIFKDLVVKLEERALAKSDKVLKYQFWGLALFVAIPLPGTGGWTGALIASVMKMNKKEAFLSILIGILSAAVVVTFITYFLVGNII